MRGDGWGMVAVASAACPLEIMPPVPTQAAVHAWSAFLVAQVALVSSLTLMEQEGLEVVFIRAQGSVQDRDWYLNPSNIGILAPALEAVVLQDIRVPRRIYIIGEYSPKRRYQDLTSFLTLSLIHI